MMKIIKNNIYKIFAVLMLQIFLCGITTFANQVKEMDIDVLVHNDGSATITQKWQGSFTTGTENYLPITTNDFTVSNFRVFMDDREFSYVNNWDVDASFNKKKYKCGINRTYEGIELCFGISDYGNHTYIFSYDISSLVKSFTDKDGFNFMFVNQDMSTFPSDMRLRIRLDNGTSLSKENARIWGFGFDGEVEFQQGEVRAWTNSSLCGYQYVVLMMCLDKDIIYPSVSVNKSFDDIRNRAFEGSDYETYEKNRGSLDWIDLIFKGMIFLVVATTIISIISLVKRTMTLKRFYKECPYFRDTPNRGNMDITYVLNKDFDLWNTKENNIIGALIMKLIHDKYLMPIEEKKVGFFGFEKVNTSLEINQDKKVNFDDDLEQELYDIICVSAGADHILQEKELEKYATVNYQKFIDFIDRAERYGHSKLSSICAYKKVLGKNFNDLSNAGQKELAEVYGLRKYLDEFTLIAEREVKEISVWENYLIYATLFGIADKVMKTLKKLYPQYNVQIQQYEKSIYISDCYNMAMYNSAYKAYNSAKHITKDSFEGFGGHVSFGGGGGFSGGGSGGGSR